MTGEFENFWSGSIDPSATNPAKAILRQQAINLSRLTHNIVEANVISTLVTDDVQGFANPPKYIHCLEIIPTTLGYTSIQLLCIEQGLLFEYPLTVTSNFWSKKDPCKCDDIKQFNQCLREILSSKETADLINSLIAQSA